VFESLVAFRPLVECCRSDSRAGRSPRYKTEIFFVAAGRPLVLGDFRHRDSSPKGDNGYRSQPLTEKVGTSYWMGTLAIQTREVGDRRRNAFARHLPTCQNPVVHDFGSRRLPLWKSTATRTSSSKLFPLRPMMPQVSHGSHSVHSARGSGLQSSARGLLESVAKLIESDAPAGQKPDDGGTWRCRMLAGGTT